MSKRKVLYLQLHDPLHSPRVGQIPAQLPSQTKTLDGLSMVIENGTVYVDFSYQSKKVSFAISTYKVAELEPINE